MSESRITDRLLFNIHWDDKHFKKLANDVNTTYENLTTVAAVAKWYIWLFVSKVFKITMDENSLSSLNSLNSGNNSSYRLTQQRDNFR